jgi:hypothetical protein
MGLLCLTALRSGRLTTICFSKRARPGNKKASALAGLKINSLDGAIKDKRRIP